MKNFKPNLIPNNPKDGSFSKEKRDELILSLGGIDRYFISNKKDGCRMQLGLMQVPLTRSLKEVKSELVNKRFEAINNICLKEKITLDGEFYMHGEKFNTILSFFANTDVTRSDFKSKLRKKYNKDPKKFKEDYNNRSIEFLTTFHEDLKFYLFDGTILDRPDITKFSDRMLEIENRLNKYNMQDVFVELFDCTVLESNDLGNLDYLYEMSLKNGYEGLVLTHFDHEYKFGRTTLKSGTILKIKDDEREYDGVVIDVIEGTKVKEGVEKTTNELGRSRTSKKKDDREPSGMAKGFLVSFEDRGTFTVNLRGFDNEDKKELLKNKDNYIGRHFKYSGMPPVKDFPRSVYFDCWRDEK